MNQLVQELMVYTIDNKQTIPRQDALFYKQILDEPIYQNAGSLKLLGDTSSFYELKDVNYVYLTSSENFNLIINDMVIINTQQFTYVNQYRYITLAVQCNPNQPQVVNFAYGNLELGNEALGLSIIEQKPTCGAKWDRVLKNIIITTDGSSTDPTIYPNISHICGSL